MRRGKLVINRIGFTVQNAHIQVTSIAGKIVGKVPISEIGKGRVIIQSKNFPLAPIIILWY